MTGAGLLLLIVVCAGALVIITITGAAWPALAVVVALVATVFDGVTSDHRPHR